MSFEKFHEFVKKQMLKFKLSDVYWDDNIMITLSATLMFN